MDNEGIVDAPSDGTGYVRKDAAWEAESAGGGLEDAPVDGTIYARKDGAWVLIDGTIVAKTASSTLALVDAYDHISYTSVNATECTVPTNASVAFLIGTEIRVTQGGAGKVTIVADSGVIINSLLGLKIAGQHGVGILKKVATDTWLFYGDSVSADPIQEPVTYISAQADVSGLITEWVGSISSGSATLTTTAPSDFTIGEGIAIEGAGNGYVEGIFRYGTWMVTTVDNISGTTITLSDNASHTVSGNNIYHDDTAAINAALIAVDGAIVMDTDSNIGHVNLVNNKNMYGEGGKVLYCALYVNSIAYIESNFTADSITNVRIQGITFDGRKYTGSTTDKQLGASSILVQDSDAITILECTFQNNPYVSTQLFGSGTNHNIHHNDFLDVDVAVMIMPKYLGALQTDNIKVEDNYINGIKQ